MAKKRQKQPVIQSFQPDYLGLNSGKADGKPVAIMSLRPMPGSFESVNMMFNRATLERMKEDIEYILKYSAYLHQGKPMSPEVSIVQLDKLKI